MSNLQICTLTGIDPSVDFEDIWALAERYPFAEFGVLFSEKQQGHGRYPNFGWVEDLAERVRQRPGPRLALHVCGRAVRGFLQVVSAGNTHPHFRADIRHLLDVFPRVQLNLRAEPSTVGRIIDATYRYPRNVFITQHNAANAWLAERVGVRDGHAALFDESGGRGESPEAWPEPLGGVVCGYAGGLGPDNLMSELPRIDAMAGDRPFWIDMEGKLRDRLDQFDIHRARECLEIVKTYQSISRTVVTDTPA